MLKPWLVTMSHYERIVAEGLVHHSSIEECIQKMRQKANAEIKERPLTINIESAAPHDKHMTEFMLD